MTENSSQSHRDYQLQAEPTTLDFGAVPVGTSSAPQTVTITNSGAELIEIIEVNTATESYAHATNCSSLAAGASCTIKIVFLPTVNGPATDALTITTHPAGLLAPIPLNGTGITPKNAIKDAADNKNIRDSKVVHDKQSGPLEQIVRPVATSAPTKQDAVEPAEGSAFIQPAERPMVGTQALQEPA